MVRRTLVVAVVALSLLGGCSSGAASTVSGAARGPAPPTGSANALDLRDAPVSALVGQLADAVGMPVTVDADAVPLTRCARVTFVAPAGTPRAQLVALATDVLRSAALSLTNAGDHLTVERIADAEVPRGLPRDGGTIERRGQPITMTYLRRAVTPRVPGAPR